VIGIVETGLQEGHLPIVLKTIDIKAVRGEAQLGHATGREYSLKGEVMDLHQCGRPLPTMSVQIGWCESALPVITVNYLGSPLEWAGIG
jgi:hypothetical protein